jgi:hypothetical protein
MKLSIRVNTGGDDYIVETNLYHIIQLERKYKVKASDLANGISIEQLGFLAHEAAKTGNFAPPLQLDEQQQREPNSSAVQLLSKLSKASTPNTARSSTVTPKASSPHYSPRLKALILRCLCRA